MPPWSHSGSGPWVRRASPRRPSSSPAAKRGDAVVVAVAARDRAGPSAFAAKHGIPTRPRLVRRADRRSRDRRDLQPAPERAARRSGRSPRSKPASTCSARSRSPRTQKRPRRSPRSRERTGLVVMEAFHYRYHPLARRMREIVDGGETRTSRAASRRACASRSRCSPTSGTIDLAGGATMDVGLLHGAPAPAAGGRGADGHDSNCQAAFTRRRPLDARRDDLP